MKHVKRSLSVLLAVVMVFTTMAVAFTVVSSAAPIVPRVPATRLSPTVELTVPQVIETWGTDYYQSGSNVIAVGEIQATIVSHVAQTPVQDVSLSCSDAGIQISPRQMAGEGVSLWTIQGGTLKTPPADDGTTVVKWTISCNIAGKSYVTYAWSQVQPHYNNPGFAVRVTHKNNLSSHRTYNHHVEWIQPVFGDPATDTADNYSQCYVSEGDGQHYAAEGIHAASYYWNWNQGGGDDERHTAALTAKGSLYVDVSQKSDLETVGLASRAKPHHELEDPSNHPQYFGSEKGDKGTIITSQSVNGNTSNVFSVNSPGQTEVGVGGEIGASFAGQLPAAGGTAKINAQIIWEGQITRTLGVTQKSYHITQCNYQISIVTYDKTALRAEIDAVTSANYQASQFRNTAPAGANSGFKTWDEYLTALQNAWYIYGRQDVTQAQINAAKDALNAATPKYTSGNNGEWVSGMMYADADYSQINTIKSTIADTLDPDFYEDYSDGTHGKYYQFSLASALNEALEDIDYEENTQHKLLDARYQSVVDQMRANLTNAINAMVETSTKKTTKLITMEFEANLSGVTNMPAAVTTSLTGQFQKPATDPSRQYYAFTGWFYDAAATQPVSWSVYPNPASPYFKADLDTKVDNAGVAYTVYAGWRVTGKMLRFDTQGGSPIESYVGADGEQYTGPDEVPTKTGCRFVAWYLDDTFETPVNWDSFTLGTVSVVYAKWAEESYTVTFNANGGLFADGSPSLAVTDLYSTPVDTPVPPELANTGFDGWYYDSATTQPVNMSTFTIPDHDIQVYAKWNSEVRNLIFDPQNGEQLIVRTYDTGTRIEATEKPEVEKEGFVFSGWYRNPEGKGSPRTFPFSLTSSMTLYAKWVGEPYTVTFDPNGGTMPDTFNPYAYEGIPCGSTLTMPDDPTMEEYVFAGWMLDGEPFTETTVPARDITLVASWEEEPYVATLRLRTDAGESVEQGDIITATVSMMANRYVANHSFIIYYDKRYLQPALNGKAVTSNISGTSACSKIANRAYFTLVRNPGGHNITDCATSPTGRITPGVITPTTQWFPADWIVDARTLKDDYKNYEFIYFDAPDVNNGTRSRPTQEQDLVTFQFLVRPDAPLADGVSSYAQILISEDFIRTPERTNGKTAVCLQADAEYTNVKDWDNTTTLVVDGDQRFAVTQMHACRINFVTNGGATVDAIENAKQGGTVSLPVPTRDYYNFAGWTWTNDASDTDYVSTTNFEVPYEDSITLYAKWTGKQVTYYVRHHKQNLDASGFMENYEQQSLKGAVGKSVTATPKTYSGFTCTNPNESGVVRGETSNPLILDLWYMRNTTTITLDANGGKFQNGQQTVTLTGLFDNTVTDAPDNPTREGYTFSNWEQDTTVYTISKYPANDLTLAAKWTPKTITVRFYLDGSDTPYETLTGTYGDPIEAPTVTVNDGQLFSGWKNSSGVPFSYTTFPANDEDFYGSVGIDGNYLTLFINGTQQGDPIEVRTGTSVTEAFIGYTPDPGYRFTGWRTENSRDGALAVFPMTLSADTSLYGFTERETYSITTYIYIDGEPEDGPSVNNLFYGQAFDLPEPDDYTDMGFGFRGWYTDPEMTTLYVKPATMPAESLVLYGEYYQMTGTIVFDLNGGTGTAPASITKPIRTTVTNLPGGSGFSKKYYAFGGWSTSRTGTTAITSYKINSEGTFTLYAIWNVNYATVSFNLNGAEEGTRPESIQLEIGESVAAADLPAGADFVKTGYIFAGWAERSNATAALESYAPTTTGNKTLFAVWIADKVTLIAKEGSTTVIDEENGFIYGLSFSLTVDDLTNDYLDVIGNGHLEYSTVAAGTGTVVNVINDYSGQTDATYVIVIFGDLDGDGTLGPNDMTQMRALSAKMVNYPDGSAQALAADVNHDGMNTSSDYTLIRSASARLSTISQTI